MLNDLEHMLMNRYGHVKNKPKSEIERASIEEQMAYELFMNKPPQLGSAKITGSYVGIIDKISQQMVNKKRYTPIIKTEIKHGYRKRKMNYAIGTILMDTSIGLMEILVKALGTVEETSIQYLSKTRPDVAHLMRKKKPFSEIAKQYFKK